MRVLYIADPFLPVPPSLYGGIERIVATIIRGAQARGHQVALLAHPASTVTPSALYPLAGGAEPSHADLLTNLARVRKAAKEFRPDLIHNFGRLLYLSPFLLSPRPKIMAFHREPTPRTVRWAARAAGGSLTFTGCSESITRRGAALGGKWEAISNSVELNRYAFRERVRADAPLVFLSRLERVKGAHHAIAAARAAGRKLILAGNRALSGPEADYWKNEIAPQVGRDGVSYVGPVDDRGKSELLGRAAALLVPVEWEEPFGIVFAEALACGTPVISFRRGALPEIVEDGREGFLCDRPDKLPEAIRKIPAIDRADCRRRAEDHFSSELMCHRHEELYQRLVRPAPFLSVAEAAS